MQCNAMHCAAKQSRAAGGRQRRTVGDGDLGRGLAALPQVLVECVMQCILTHSLTVACREARGPSQGGLGGRARLQLISNAGPQRCGSPKSSRHFSTRACRILDCAPQRHGPLGRKLVSSRLDALCCATATDQAVKGVGRK